MEQRQPIMPCQVSSPERWSEVSHPYCLWNGWGTWASSGPHLTPVLWLKWLEWGNAQLWWRIALAAVRSSQEWTLVNTVSDTWQVAGCKAVGRCECCEKSSPWWCKGYVIGKQRQQTRNAYLFYWWQFEHAEIFWWDPQAHCSAIHLLSFAKEEWPQFHWPQSITWSTLCDGDVSHYPP